MRWLCVAHEKEIPDFKGIAKQGGFTAHTLGVGQFESLAELARLVALEKPAGIVLAGTCGSLFQEDVFKLYQCQHFAMPQIAGEELPDFFPRSQETAEAISIPAAQRATVLQNHGISLSAEKFSLNMGYIPREYPRPILENMEAASLAFFCHKHGISFTALLCVTNQIGPEGREQWKNNFRSAGALLAETLNLLK